MHDWREDFKNALGTIFSTVGVAALIISSLFLIETEDLMYLSFMANSATFIGLGIAINETTKTSEKIMAKEFEMRDYATAVWEFFDPRFLMDGMSVVHETRYGDEKKYFDIANDARHFFAGNVKEAVRESIREMEIVIDQKKNKCYIKFKDKD